MACDIFLSYARVKDTFGAATKFRDHLEYHLRRKTGDVNISVFQDKRDIHGGDKWQDVLRSELDSARLLLISLSPTWLNSKWCRTEYKIYCASEPLRPILPLMSDEILERHIEKGSEADAIFSELKALQIFDWCRFTDRDWRSAGINKAAGRLAEQIDRLLRRTAA